MQNKQEANVKSTLSGRNRLLPRGAFQLLIHSKWSALSTHTGNVIQDEQLIFRNDMHVTTINGKKEAVSFKESKKGYMRRRKEREGDGIVIIPKIKLKSIFYLIILLRFFFCLMTSIYVL